MPLNGMNVDSILDVADQLRRSASRIDRALREIDNLNRLAADAWRGPSAVQFCERWDGRYRAVCLRAAQQLADFAEVARRNADEQCETSNTLGANTGGIPGAHVAAAASIDPAGFVARERGSDGRDGARRATDRLVPLRDLPGDNFDNDWAGRAILGRYLGGGDDWTINNDADWSDYMKNNTTLTLAMQQYNATQAHSALQLYLSSGTTSSTFATTSSMEIENGESIVGYQYLHGTNADAGGFRHQGASNVEPLTNGTYLVTIASDYVWNDTIDPNPQYSTDNVKSKIAEILTLGRADPYDIHIGWSSSTTVVVDKNGTVISGEGWPH